MIWVRKFFVLLLSLVLLICLVGEGLSFSTKSNLGQPNKLEAWLAQSHVYSDLVNNEFNDAQQNASNDAGAGRVSLSDPAVAQAVKAVFTPTVVQGYANTFLDSNYRWLRGKTSQPDFKIDLTGIKQKLARQLGQTVATRVANLQPCTAAELDQIQSTLNSDPLTLPCGLPGLDAKTAGQQVQQQIATSSDFLTTTMLTASSLNPNSSNTGTAYYVRLHRLPALYRLNQKLPLIYAVVGLVAIIGILVLSLTRRRALRRLGWLFLTSGIILIAFKFAADSLTSTAQKKLFNNSNISQLQKSLTSFTHVVESHVVKTDLIFGIIFVIIGLGALGYIVFTRGRNGGPKPKPGAPEPVAPGTVFKGTPEAPAGPTAPRPKPPVPPLKRPTPVSTRPAKRPRLIQ